MITLDSAEQMTEHTLGLLSQIPPGEGRNFEAGGRLLTVFHTRDGGVYATQPECPHRAGPLADGLLGGTILLCPFHAWKFDLRTGEAVLGSCGLTTYPARLSTTGEIIVTVNPDD